MSKKAAECSALWELNKAAGRCSIVVQGPVEPTTSLQGYSDPDETSCAGLALPASACCFSSTKSNLIRSFRGPGFEPTTGLPGPSRLHGLLHRVRRTAASSNFNWLRGRLNRRPSVYEPDELPGCSTRVVDALYLRAFHATATPITDLAF